MPVFERNPLPRLRLDTREQLHEWLLANHVDHDGFWLIQPRPGSGGRPIPYEDIVEECLIFGWIDSTVQTFDERSSGIRLTRRKPNSVWSASNKRRLAKLEAAGLMRPAGTKAAEVAKANGMFEFLDEIDALIVPPDLAEALGQAGAVFETFPPSRRKQALYWIKSAKRDGTRRARIEKVAAAAAKGEWLF